MLLVDFGSLEESILEVSTYEKGSLLGKRADSLEISEMQLMQYSSLEASSREQLTWIKSKKSVGRPGVCSQTCTLYVPLLTAMKLREITLSLFSLSRNGDNLIMGL